MLKFLYEHWYLLLLLPGKWVCVNTVIPFVVGFDIGNRRGHGKIQGDNNKNVVSEIVLIDGIHCNHI